MAKTNIIFNDKNYSIDESSLASATAQLKSHLSTVMNGSGDTITLDGISYNVDSTKLSAAKNDFVSHLGTISGSGSSVNIGGVEYSIDSSKLSSAVFELQSVLEGFNSSVPSEERLEGDGQEFHKFAPTALTFRSTAPLNELQEVQINGVTVDPANYTLEEGSTIVTFPIDYLKTLNVGSYEVAVASDSKTVKGDFTVKALELNEHGFYYNQPYSANLPMFGGDTAFFVRDDGTYDIITVGKSLDTGEYTMDSNNIVATHPMLGTITCTISYDGTEVFCNELQVVFKLNGSTAIFADNDYIYEYKEDLGGYEVLCIDKTNAEYGAIKTGINGIDTVKLADTMFYYNNNLVIAPLIPDSITSISYAAFYSCQNLTSIEIPDSVTSIGNSAFYGCTGLTSITIPDSVASIDDGAFYGCTGLTSITIPDSVASIGNSAFYDCTGLTNVTFNGTTDQWSAITKDSYWYYNVPATYVQCSDGQVAL